MADALPLDLTSLDPLILELHGAKSWDELEDFVINRLPAALGSSFASWNEHNAELRLERVATSRSHEDLVAPLVEELNASLPTHPLFPDYFDFEQNTVIVRDQVDRARDSISREAYRELRFYQNVARPLGIEDQLVMHVYVKNGRGILLTFHGSEEFSPTQHLVAAIMRGHIVARLHTLQDAEQRHRESGRRVIRELRAVLSDRELSVLRLICDGRTNREIADALDISPRTAETHASNILSRLDCTSRFQIISHYGHWLRE